LAQTDEINAAVYKHTNTSTMARHTPLPRFHLDTDSVTEHSMTSLRAASTSPNMSQLYHEQQSQLQPQRFQVRFRRSACSDLQSTTIPEEPVYNENRRRASLLMGRPTEQTVDISKTTTYDQEPSECDYIRLCRQRCQSLYGSLPDATTVSAPVSPLILTDNTFTGSDDDDDDDDDNNEDDEDEQCFETPSANNFRHSLPDTSPSGIAIRNFLKRKKTTNHHHHHHHHQLDLPSHSSQSLCSSRSSSSSILTHSSSPLSTFRNFLSLVKLPSSSSTKSINSGTSSASTTPHHSSLTTLTSATGGSSTTLDQTISSISSKKRPTTNIDTQYQWYFEVSTHIYIELLITETTAAISSSAPS